MARDGLMDEHLRVVVEFFIRDRKLNGGSFNRIKDHSPLTTKHADECSVPGVDPEAGFSSGQIRLQASCASGQRG